MTLVGSKLIMTIGLKFSNTFSILYNLVIFNKGDLEFAQCTLHFSYNLKILFIPINSITVVESR